MGLLQSLPMLLTLLWIFLLPKLKAQLSGPPSTNDTRSVDSLLQDYAYRAFVKPKTGILYQGNVPSNLTGIKIAAMRLRSGSLRRKGVVSGINEFEIPIGIVEQPYVERLVLVYQNLGNWSLVYYPLPGYTYKAPVVGLLAYDAANLSATNLPELDIRASDKPILIRFPDVELVADRSTMKCVWFDLQGSQKFTDLISDNVCSTVQQGHFSIVVESTALPPAPISPPPGGKGHGKGKKDKWKVWKIVGLVLGALLVLVLLGLLLFWVRICKHRKKMQQMEAAAEGGEALQMASIGNTKAPVAMVTRTQPVLESEYVP